MHDELFLFEDKKRIIKFYQDYLEPMDSYLLIYIKYIVTIELFIHGTTIVTILSLSEMKYYDIILSSLIGIAAILVHIGGILAYYPYCQNFLHKKQQAKTESEILELFTHRNFVITLTLYLSIVFHFVLFGFTVITYSNTHAMAS